jgi:DNA invertase Pin-like site-specific DNA recombinase
VCVDLPVDTNTVTAGWTDASGVWTGIDLNVSGKNIYTDKVSSTKEERKSLAKLLNYVREGDTIVVWKLDRLARSLIHFTKLMQELDEKGVKFRSITESFIDTTKKSSQSEFIKLFLFRYLYVYCTYK